MIRQLADELVATGVPEEDARRIVRRPVRRLLHETLTELRDREACAAP